jgi:hypothetical protein
MFDRLRREFDYGGNPKLMFKVIHVAITGGELF